MTEINGGPGKLKAGAAHDGCRQGPQVGTNKPGHRIPRSGEGAATKRPIKIVDEKPPAAGRGRPKGSPNKSTKAVKEALQLAFDGVGGVNALTTWAKANETEFYKLWVKMLPQDVAVKGDLTVNAIERRIVSAQTGH